MDLSIVILHHGGAQEVTANLAALARAQLPASFEIFVVNNGERGANDAIQVPEALRPQLQFFEIENRGYAQGNNFALDLAKGHFLCILNPDVEVAPETFQVLMKYLTEHPQVGLVAPRLRYPSGQIQDNFRVFPRVFDLLVKRTFLRHIFRGRMRSYLMWEKDPFKSEAVDWLTGAFHFFPRRVWQELGPQDERYFLFMSDVDFCRQLWKKKWEVHFVGATEVLHRAARLSGGGVLDLLKKWTLRVHLLDAMRYYWKWMWQ